MKKKKKKKKVKAVNNCGFFQIQLGHLAFSSASFGRGAPFFVISIGTERHVFVSHNAAGFVWTSNLYIPLHPDKTD